MTNTLEILVENLGRPGRMISASKSGYQLRHPNNIVIFNANIAIVRYNKIWYGDLDLTADKDLLLKCSKEIGKPLYIFYETDLRFQNELLNVLEAVRSCFKYYIVDGNENEIIEYVK